MTRIIILNIAKHSTSQWGDLTFKVHVNNIVVPLHWRLLILMLAFFFPGTSNVRKDRKPRPQQSVSRKYFENPNGQSKKNLLKFKVGMTGFEPAASPS
jgi:hypothetical protein